MWRFFARRFLFFVFTLIFTSMIVFFLLRVLPGDVARVIAGGREAPRERVEEVRQRLGLDEPIVKQYFTWGADFIRGDWGRSTALPGSDNREIILQRTRNSARLAFIALLFSVPISITLGVISGLTEGKLIDNLISILTLSVVSLPEFVTGLFLINVVALKWADNPIAQELGWF
ncbi:MAG TPA: ABC transporter permease, partial [Aggregatilineales bacterium]|nr:ABC transporter permease [Aggregatilineales bacterium]